MTDKKKSILINAPESFFKQVEKLKKQIPENTKTAAIIWAVNQTQKPK